MEIIIGKRVLFVLLALCVCALSSANENDMSEFSASHSQPGYRVMGLSEFFEDLEEIYPSNRATAQDVPSMVFNPSILSGRPQQYDVGERWLELPLSCAYGEDIYPGGLTVSLESYSDFGGHNTNPHSGKPAGKIIWKGQTSGDYMPSSSGTETSAYLSFNVTVSDQESGEKLKIVFPEYAGEVLAEFSSYCDFSDLPLGVVEISYPLLFRLEFPVGLVRLSDTLSNNGKAEMIIERASNSHGNHAGYASATTEGNLEALINSYGACPANAQLPMGQTRTLTVTGASLPYGGKYDIYLNWQGSHLNHRAGEDIDVGLSAIAGNSSLLECLNDAIDDSGFVMPVSSESLSVDPSTGQVIANGNHVHLWSGEVTNFPQDQSPEE